MTAIEPAGSTPEPTNVAGVAGGRPTVSGARSGGEWLSELSRHSGSRAVRHLRRLLQTDLSTMLGLDPGVVLGLRERFVDLGLQSLRAVEVRDVLEERLLCKLNSTLLFDYPTVESLADYLMREVVGLEP